MLKIGNLKLKSRLILAPMAGVSDYPYRMINRKFGFELAFTEMINCRSLSFKSKKTKRMLYFDSNDKPIGIQLLAAHPEYLLRALEVIKDYKFDIIDFNAACPVKKVVNRGEGAALLKHPKKLNRLLRIIVKESSVPVTVKLRTGWDGKVSDIKELASACEDSGIDAIFIHGRTREQAYGGDIDYETIKELKDHVKIPVIASGNVLNPQLAKKMFDETDCDAVLVARGALGNPWIFKEISGFLKDGSSMKEPSKSERIEAIKRHLDMNVDFYGEKNGVKLFRRFLIWYTKGLPKIRTLRETINRMKTKESMVDFIDRCFYL
ncbi:MAG: tRNA dihydrouridine synthase DusB [Candidatus Omnitrophica bacterium]|nr:tRNA dihydrouridine synthase DusB [Candidatus Omnitrophota bacterium]HOX54396.1 tRNA dihydrouridine synthase DusB [Candidatus Omnitrophota bacterium]